MKRYIVAIEVLAESAQDAWVVAVPDEGVDLSHAGIEEYEVLNIEVTEADD